MVLHKFPSGWVSKWALSTFNGISARYFIGYSVPQELDEEKSRDY